MEGKKHYTTHKASYKTQVRRVSDETPIVTMVEESVGGTRKSITRKSSPEDEGGWGGKECASPIRSEGE